MIIDCSSYGPGSGVKPEPKVTARDARGWRVPRAGTKSRAVYDLMVTGARAKSITAALGGNGQTVRVLMWKIRRPLAANKAALKSYYKRRVRDDEK